MIPVHAEAAKNINTAAGNRLKAMLSGGAQWSAGGFSGGFCADVLQI